MGIAALTRRGTKEATSNCTVMTFSWIWLQLIVLFVEEAAAFVLERYDTHVRSKDTSREHRTESSSRVHEIQQAHATTRGGDKVEKTDLKLKFPQ